MRTEFDFLPVVCLRHAQYFLLFSIINHPKGKPPFVGTLSSRRTPFVCPPCIVLLGLMAFTAFCLLAAFHSLLHVFFSLAFFLRTYVRLFVAYYLWQCRQGERKGGVPGRKDT